MPIITKDTPKPVVDMLLRQIESWVERPDTFALVYRPADPCVFIGPIGQMDPKLSTAIRFSKVSSGGDTTISPTTASDATKLGGLIDAQGTLRQDP